MMERYIGILSVGAFVFGFSYQYNRRLVDWLRFQSLGTRDYITEKLSLMFIEVTPQQILLAQMAMSFGLGGIVFLWFLPNLVPSFMLGILVTVAGWKAPKPLVDYFFQRRLDKFNLQMVDALSLMSNGLKSGLSVVQAMGLVVQEMPNPVRQEFNLVLSQNNLGVPLEETFINLSKRVPTDDVEMFVTAINILKETGGNLAETFDTIVSTIRERIKVENKIKAITTNGFRQGMILLAVPPLLALIISMSDPEFLSPMFTTTLGWVAVMVILGLLILGFFVIMRIIKIEV